VDPHHANPALSISVLDQRHGQRPPVDRANPARRFAPAMAVLEQRFLSNVRATGKPAKRNRLGMALVLL